MRYFKGAEAKVVSAFKALPLDAMKDMIDKRQAMKDKADDNYSILKASLEADVSPVDQPRYLAIKQSFYSAIDELSNSNLSPEQSARVAVALNTQLRNEMTTGFTAQAVGNKKRILEHREELRKKAKDLNLNDNEIDQFIKAGENEFIQGGGSMDPERGVFRNYEGLNPVKRTDYNKYGRDFAAAVKTGSIERVNQVLQDYGMYGKRIGNSSKFSGFSNKLELQQFLKSPESLRDAHVNAIMSNPEHIQALQQDFELGYHRQYGRDWKEALYNMAGNSMQDLSYFEATTGHTENEEGMYSWRQKLNDRNYEEAKAHRVGYVQNEIDVPLLGGSLEVSQLPSVLNAIIKGDDSNPYAKGYKNLMNTVADDLERRIKNKSLTPSKANDLMIQYAEAIGLDKAGTMLTRGVSFQDSPKLFDDNGKRLDMNTSFYSNFEPITDVSTSGNANTIARALSSTKYLDEKNPNVTLDWSVPTGDNAGARFLDNFSNMKIPALSTSLTDFQNSKIKSFNFPSNFTPGSTVKLNNGQTYMSGIEVTEIPAKGTIPASRTEKVVYRLLPENNLDPFFGNGPSNNLFKESEPSNNPTIYLPSITTPLGQSGKGDVNTLP
jgi:hypothetical protein